MTDTIRRSARQRYVTLIEPAPTPNRAQPDLPPCGHPHPTGVACGLDRNHRSTEHIHCANGNVTRWAA